MVSYEPKIAEGKIRRYAYDPHLSPQLVWAGKPGLKSIEVEDASGINVDSVALHVHERVSTQAIIMKELTDKQIARQDFVDNAIFQLVQTVNPTDKSVEWNIEMIGEVRDVIRKWIVQRMKMTDEQDFYSYLYDSKGVVV
jgi:hypothetical protein